MAEFDFTTPAVRSLIKTGRAVIDIPENFLNDQTFTQIMKPFVDMTDSSTREQKLLCADFSGKKNDPDDGLVYKEGEALNDNKFFFHYRPRLHEYFRNKFGKKRFSSYASFLEDMKSLYNVTASITEDLIREFDAQLHGFNFWEKYKAKKHPNVLRLLRYLPPSLRKHTQNKILAKYHLDKSFITVHLYESSPGLVFIDKNGNYKQYIGAKYQIEVFLGLKAELLTDKKLYATPHYVYDSGDSSRLSVVFFTHIETPFTEEYIESIIKSKKKAFSDYRIF